MKKIIVFAVFVFGCFSVFAKKYTGGTSYKQKKIEGEKIELNEVWGYVMQGREYELQEATPLTDVGYFAAEVDTYGHLSNVPKRKSLKNFSGRVHLVLVCDSRSLTHFVLDQTFGLRKTLIDDIIKAAKDYDGVQVDYELIPGKDVKNFLSFLEDLASKTKSNGKIFSVCVPARIKTISDDAFPYEKIAKVADKLIIMAYDEHWSTSKPGAVASLSWCKMIRDYAVSVLPLEKIVMGLPFYGRTWASEKVAQGWYFSGVNRIMKEYKAKKVQYDDGVPHTNIKMKVDVNCYFEDAYSTVQKLNLYKESGITSVAFWRIGQEDASVWQWINVVKNP